MQNIDTTFKWDPNKQQTFISPGVTILKGLPETFNKLQGCGLDVYGIATDGTTSGPLILVPDASSESGIIDWAVPSTSAAFKYGSFNFLEKSDFRISGDMQLRTTKFIDGLNLEFQYPMTFNLYDDSRVRFENLSYVILSMTILDTRRTPDFHGFLNPQFSISAEVVQLFYKAFLYGNSILDVTANVIETAKPGGIESGGLFLWDNAGLVINQDLSQQVESELRLMSALHFYNFSFGNITSRTIYNDISDNAIAGIKAIDQSIVSICTEQFLQGMGQGKIINLSGAAKVIINPMNGIIPINPVEEMYHPTEKCWPGMINFESGSMATLKLVGAALQSDQTVAALNSLKLVHVDGKPVDIASNFRIDFTDGISLRLK